MESLSLIDVALEDDLLIPADEIPEDPQPSENHEMRKVSFFLESSSIWEGENPAKASKQTEQTPEMSESPELKPAKSGKLNLRKSLAWDSAFFTSEGVLENEELAIVNSTFRKAESCKLTGIQEDLRKSSDSTSTLNSETYALENLEVGLFDNLRASIQMSLGKDDKASSGLSGAPCLGSVKKIGLLNKVKSPVNSKKDGANKQYHHFVSKEAATGVKVGSGQSKPLSRPPRNVPKPMPTVPSTRASSGKSLQLKGNGVNQQFAVASNKTNGNLRSVTSRPNSSAEHSPGSRTGLISRSTTKIPSRTPTNRLPPSKLGFLSKASPRSSIESTLSSESSSATNRTKLSSSVESLGSSSTSSSSVPPRSSPNTLTDSKAGARCSKPSGLRMPSPKIGYFDAEKTLVCSSDKISQPNLRKNLVKSTNAISNIAGGNKQKTAKGPTVRPAVHRAVENVDLRKSHSTSKSPNDSTRRALPVSTHQRKKSGESIAPVRSAAAVKVDSPKTPSASKSPNDDTRRASPVSMRPRKESGESTVPVGPAAQCALPKIGSASKSPSDGTRRASPVSMRQSKGCGEPITPVRPAAQRAAEKFDSPKTLSASKSPDGSTRRASPMSCQREERAELHTDLIVATDEDNQDASLRSADGRLRASMELLKHEQGKSSTDGRDEHAENIDSVADKSEKENLFPMYEANGVTRPSTLSHRKQAVSTVESLAKQISRLSLSEK